MNNINNTIELLGQQILSSEEYTAFKKAEAVYQADSALSALVNEFDNCRNELIMARSGETPDEEKITKIQDRMEELCGKIMENDNMKIYNEAAGKFEGLMKRVFDEVAYTPSGIYIKQESKIPMTRGLGSSSACIVGGMLGANVISGRKMSYNDILNLIKK